MRCLRCKSLNLFTIDGRKSSLEQITGCSTMYGLKSINSLPFDSQILMSASERTKSFISNSIKKLSQVSLSYSFVIGNSLISNNSLLKYCYSVTIPELSPPNLALELVELTELLSGST